MLTKSDFLRFLQCKKYLWLYQHRKDLLGEFSEQRKAIISQGDAVEKIAKKLFPDFKYQLEVIAPFGGKKNQLKARADFVMIDPKTGVHDLYEVKSSSKVKPEHLPDLAFQKITFERAGYKVGKTFLVHINNEYVRTGEIDPEKLLISEDITEDVAEQVPEIEQMIPEALATIDLPDEVQVRIIKQCTKPYDCPFIPYCWPQARIPDYSVYDLTHINEKTLVELLDRKIMKIEDIPADIKLRKNQADQVAVAKTKKPIIEKAKIKAELKKLKYPLYFLDYETVMPAIPLWDGTKPYLQICFQYSLHVQRSASAKLEHYEFLHQGKDNPMPALLKQLQKELGDDDGTVIVWNKSFEMNRNKEMAGLFPEYKKFLHAINDRVYDLIDIFKKGYYVDPNFHGSNSIKSVLPALVPELDYGNLEDIQQGTMAGLRWLQINFGKVTAADKKKIQRNLLKYCERDTLAMVKVLEVVEGS